MDELKFEEEIFKAITGITPEEYNCVDGRTAVSILMDKADDPINVLIDFISNCSIAKFEELKDMDWELYQKTQI